MNICIKRSYLNEEWDSDDNLVLVNRTDNEYLDEATIDEIKMFQWFLTNMSEEDKEWMQKNFPDLIFSYSDKLGLWILCVDHFGTMWKGVSTTTNCENAAKASQLP